MNNSTISLFILSISICCGYQQIVQQNCDQITSQTTCDNIKETNKWCKWNTKLSKCDTNYDKALFHNALNAGIPSILFYCIIISISCYIVTEIISKQFIIKYLKLFHANLDSTRELQSIMHLSQLIIMIIIFMIFCINGSFSIILSPSEFNNLSPSEFKKQIETIVINLTFIVLMYVLELYMESKNYTIEVSLKLQHFIVFTMFLLFIMAYDERVDIDILRQIICFIMYIIFESISFIQLFLYRTNPTKYFIAHLVYCLVWH